MDINCKFYELGIEGGKRKKPPLPRRWGGEDCYQTPPEALSPLLPYLRKEWVIWECACGKENLSNRLKKLGYEVVASDILKGQDFLTCGEPENYDCIVTNPPYSMKDQFLERAYHLGKPFAFLLPITALGGKRRQALYPQYGLEVIFLGERINFEPPSGSGSGNWFETAWFTNGLKIGRQITWADLSSNSFSQGEWDMDKLIAKEKKEEIINLHREVQEGLLLTVEKVARLGQLLSEVKAELGHGEFGHWIRANLPFSQDTAERYMKVATWWASEMSKSARLRNLDMSLVDVYKLLPHKPKPKLAPKPVTEATPVSEEPTPIQDSQVKKSQVQESESPGAEKKFELIQTQPEPIQTQEESEQEPQKSQNDPDAVRILLSHELFQRLTRICDRFLKQHKVVSIGQLVSKAITEFCDKVEGKDAVELKKEKRAKPEQKPKKKSNRSQNLPEGDAKFPHLKKLPGNAQYTQRRRDEV